MGLRCRLFPQHPRFHLHYFLIVIQEKCKKKHRYCPFLWVPVYSCLFLWIPSVNSSRNQWRNEKYWYLEGHGPSPQPEGFNSPQVFFQRTNFHPFTSSSSLISTLPSNPWANPSYNKLRCTVIQWLKKLSQCLHILQRSDYYETMA